jgi:ABC-type transport system involved in multi-copper enzyme maturation permease subunit
MLTAAMLFAVISSIILSASIINLDFASGIYRQLYASGVSRAKILRQKFLAFLSANGAVFALFAAVIFITSLAYGINYKSVLVVDAKSVHEVSTALFCAYTYGSIMLSLLLFSLVFFAVGLLIRNIYSAIIVNALIIGGSLVLSSITSGFMATLTAEPISYYWGSAGLAAFWGLYIAKYAIVIGFFLLARSMFLKRDL